MKKSVFRKYSMILLIFLIGSFIGFVHENLLEIIQGYNRLKQGLIYEPLIPVYGFGALAYYFVYKDIKLENRKKITRVLTIFGIGFLVGGGIEYMLSYAQEKIFGTISWNYTYMKFNLNGRTSLFHASFWGLAGVLFYFVILPLFKKMDTYLEKKPNYILIGLLSAILLFDASISTIACLRHMDRRDGVVPRNKVEMYLDVHYPDELLNKIYTTAIVPKR